MFPSQKLNSLAHVAMTLLITVASTTARFSRTDIRNATVAITSTAVTATSASTGARTPLTATEDTPVDIPSETTSVKLTDSNTKIVFSIPTNSEKRTKNPTGATVDFQTTSLKNTTSIDFTPTEKIISNPNSITNKTLSPVHNTTSKQTEKLPLTDDKTTIDKINAIKLTSAKERNRPTISNGTRTHQTLADSLLFDTIANGTNASESSANVNTQHGAKLADTENTQNLLTGSSFTRAAPEKQHFRDKSSTEPRGFNKIARTNWRDKNKVGDQRNSTPLLFWRQTVHLPRRRFAALKNVLRRSVDVRITKYSSDEYSTDKRVTSRKLLTQKLTHIGHESLIHSKITSTKPEQLLKFPSKPFNLETKNFDFNVVPSFYKPSSEINKEKGTLYPDKNNAGNDFKKEYEIKTDGRQTNFDADLINGDSGPRKSNQNMLVPIMTSPNSDLLTENVCRHCIRIKAQNRISGFLKNRNNRKRNRRHLNNLGPRSSKGQLTINVNTHHVKANKLESERLPSLVGTVKQPEDYVNLKNNELYFVTENEKAPHHLLQKHSHFPDEVKKETDAGYIQFSSSEPDNDQPRPMISGEDKLLNYKDQVELRNDVKGNTNMDILKFEKHNDMNYSRNIEKTSKTEAIYNVSTKCKGSNLCPVQRDELPVTLKPILHNPVRITTRTSFTFQEDGKKEKYLISVMNKLLTKVENSGYTSGKYIKNMSWETAQRNLKEDINVVHKTDETSIGDNPAVLIDSKESSEDLLKSQTKFPFGEKSIEKPSERKKQSLMRDDLTVKIKDNILVGNVKENIAKNSDNNVQLIKNSGTLIKEITIDGDRPTPENINESGLINNGTENIFPMPETFVQQKITKQDYMYKNFKAKIVANKENKESIKKSSPNIAQRQDFPDEKHVDSFTKTDTTIAALTDESDPLNHEESISGINPKSFSDDVIEEDDILDTNVKLRPIHALNSFTQQENMKYSWLKNAYESISYRKSHDFFLDPEIEKDYLERKILRRHGGRLFSDERQRRDTSTHADDIYLYLQNTQDRYHRTPTTSIYNEANILGHGVVDSGQHYPRRTKRSTGSVWTDSRNTLDFTGVHASFNKRVVDDDDNKPCGNHGRHRSNVGGMHHLSRHQRRDIYREPHTRRRYPRETRFPSEPKSFSGDDFGKAAYFSGIRELLQLRVRKRLGLAQDMIPRQHFTIELWIKPEGGQSNPTVILGLFDMCHQDHKSKGWHIGIRTYEEGQEEDARIYFSLETDRANSPSVLMSDRTYEPNRWVHVAASYSGKKMKLYINAALVGVQHLHSGDIFSLSASSCKEIFIGGMPYSKEDLYRGSVDQILLWNFPLKHGDVVQNMFDSGINMDREKGIVFKESFNDLSQWKSFLKDEPVLHFANIEDYRYDIQLVAPPCGKTVCDDPDVIRSYVRHSELRQEKRVRYRIVNVMDDDNENPKVSKTQTVAQHRALVATFKQYNISWELEEVKLRSTSLRHKTVLLDCLPMQIGDKHCNRECQHTQTGNDGGDCDPDEIPCDSINLGNGRCDFECNRAYYEWDKGDCCQSAFRSSNSTCLDPNSPHRIYLSMDEYKTALNVNGSTHLNVYLASWSLKGLATFPWEKHVYGVLGGTVVDTNSFGQPGKMDGLIHEFGHNLGLWHVHHGISEVKCDDQCMEKEASLELGDLCSDTAPTTQNTHCRDPDWNVHACGIGSFKNTPYRNYMSYASGNCTNHFTPQQVARMHCYLDLVYQPWQTIMRPSPVPLPPKVVAATLDSVTFVWLPGLGDNVYGSHSECHKCTQDGALIQYASSARAPADSKRKLHWNKEEALGPPDAERCKASSLSWMQETYECKSKCYIEFMFKYNTVPQSISIWVVWKAAVGIKTVKFYFMDGSTDTIGPIRAFCDMPFTAKLNYTKKVKKVRIYPNNTYVGIDAIQLISTPESARICSSCRPTKYQVKRSPDFPRPVYTSDTIYTDGSVVRGINYSYTIQVNIGNKVSGPSPALHYQHGEPFCGNGRVETNLGEVCDDGNVNDGDGCTANCNIENFYRCKGTPSLCYRHDGDGICEEDEQNISVRDCGYHTPEGYDDQWPVSAVGNPRHPMTPKCSEEVLIGAPTRFQVCKNNVELPGTWRPCNANYFSTHDYWIKVYYMRPVIAVGVVIYLGSDGRTYDSPEPKSLLVQLIDTEDRLTYVEHKLVVSCQANPIYVAILHDLSRPFFRTKGVKLLLSSSNIAIAGIRLRTSQHFDPITPESCSQEQFYNPRSQQCVNQTCPRKFCEQLITENANTTCTGRGEGDTCQVTCLDGYRIRNELDEVICADGVWRRSNEVSCVPVDCRWPSMVHATFICPQGTSFKQSCSFRCNPPAQLQGSGSMVTCEADGRWSMVNAYCLAFCHSPIEHPYAYPTSRSCQIEKAHQAGTRCKFRCEKGYHIDGMPAKRRSLHLTCKESGQWEGKRCVRVMCKKIPPEFTGMYTCSESTLGGSRCILKCPHESRPQKIKCLQKGTWSSNFKMCHFPKSSMCRSPVLIDHRIQIRNCHDRTAGSTCEVTCNSQAYQPALPYMNGTVFDSKDRVMKLTCTGMLKWLPNPRHITCKGTCRVVALKDGWCDSSNNRLFCDWDRGDCCASTVDGGKIRLDNPTCKSKCACKDPNAKENSNKSKK